jgi:hypothetical protein
MLPGPETDVVEQFLAAYRPRLGAGTQVSLFREPAVPSGFPDVVAVTWNEHAARAWTDERRRLSSTDLRLLHLLATAGPLSIERLAALSFTRLRPALGRLEQLGLVRGHRGRWTTIPLKQCFAVRSIVAFEAKVSDWAGAVEQAWTNRWFASESYVLLPRLPRSSGVVSLATARGVGIWIAGSRRPVLAAAPASVRQPVSFASWMFNEWVCGEASQAMPVGGLHDYCRVAGDTVR